MKISHNLKKKHGGRPILLIIGSDGLIGGGLREYIANKNKEVWETTRRIDTTSKKRLYLDLSSDITRWSPPKSVTACYICAGTSIQYCKKYPKKSRIINVDNVVLLAKKLISDSSFVIFLSSNYVYDGSMPFQKPNKPTSPLTEYARQKAAAEKRLISLGKSVTILRSTKVFSSKMPLFMKWIRDLQNNKTIHPARDKVVSPIPLFFMIDVLYYLSKIHASGIMQISGEMDVTYADIAYQIVKYLKVSRKLVAPFSSTDLQIDTHLVAPHATLESSKVLLDKGIKPPKVWDTINWMIRENAKSVQSYSS